MIRLKLFKTNKTSKKQMEIMKFDSVEEAIRFGNQSGCSWSVDDQKSGRSYDCDEIENREEEDWYYDEAELIWKRNPDGNTLKRMFSIAMPFIGRLAGECRVAGI